MLAEPLMGSAIETFPMDPVSLIVLSFLLPPLAVYLAVGIGDALWLNLLLTLMGYIPGIIHALIVVT